jgi:uncharacterized OsmC-like protein
MAEDTNRVELTQDQDYRFTVSYGGGVPPLIADEPPPLGAGTGPSPVQLLATSVGTCMASSLLFAVRKYKEDPGRITGVVEAQVGRNEAGRLRVLSMSVLLTLGVPASQVSHLARAVAQFEAFCTVTQSINQCIAITVEVRDVDGVLVT